MSDFLFVTWDGGGNVPPALAMARALQERGHAVRFLGHAAQHDALTAAGVDVVGGRYARSFSGREVSSPLALLAAFGDRGMGHDLLDAVAEGPADLVVVDCLMFGALDAARRAGLRYAVLEHLYDTYYESGCLRGPLGLSLALRRLRPRRALAQAAVRLATTLPSLDAAGAAVTQVGPVTEWSPRVHDDEPMVLVSLSTFAFAGMTGALQRLLAATRGLDARVVVTTGPAVDPGDLVVPRGVEVHRFVPHRELMRRATLFVGHGGHGSTMAALAHDLPMVLMPMDSRVDQPAVAGTIKAAGAARVVDKSDPVEVLAPVLAEMLEDGPHRPAAARLGAEVRAMPGAALGADALESLVGRDLPAC